MAPQHDDPASRLREVLLAVHAAYPGRRDQEPVTGWVAFAQVLGLGENSPDGVQAIANVIQLPSAISAAVRALGEEQDEEEHLLLHLDSLEGAMAALASRQGLYQVFCTFAPDGQVDKSGAIQNLLYVGRVLNRARPALPLSSEDAARLDELISEMIQIVTTADLPPDVAMLMLSHLHSM